MTMQKGEQPKNKQLILKTKRKTYLSHMQIPRQTPNTMVFTYGQQRGPLTRSQHPSMDADCSLVAMSQVLHPPPHCQRRRNERLEGQQQVPVKHITLTSTELRNHPCQEPPTALKQQIQLQHPTTTKKPPNHKDPYSQVHT